MGADYRTITLDIAIQAVRAYNTDAYYSASKGLDLDRRARQLFTNGLAAPAMAYWNRFTS